MHNNLLYMYALFIITIHQNKGKDLYYYYTKGKNWTATFIHLGLECDSTPSRIITQNLNKLW